MSLPAIVQRRAVHSAQLVKRHASSKASVVKSHRTLPSAKMRGLISLYHQAEHFITPENLSQRIDEAFVPNLDVRLGQKNISTQDLQAILASQRNAPRVSDWDEEASLSTQQSSYKGGSWSSIKASREMKVIEALYGVDATDATKVFPGLGALEDPESFKLSKQPPKRTTPAKPVPT